MNQKVFTNCSVIFFVVSLPRTGTKSVCKMADLCDLKPMHVLDTSKRLISHIENGYNFFADTPFYNPNFFNSALNLGSSGIR